MTSIPATELANQLPHILQAIASGEEFLVTDDGRPVARIVPPPSSVPKEPLAADQWQREFDAWMKEVEARADRYPPGFVLDDSYEAIYGEREERAAMILLDANVALRLADSTHVQPPKSTANRGLVAAI